MKIQKETKTKYPYNNNNNQMKSIELGHMLDRLPLARSRSRSRRILLSFHRRA